MSKEQDNGLTSVELKSKAAELLTRFAWRIQNNEEFKKVLAERWVKAPSGSTAEPEKVKFVQDKAVWEIDFGKSMGIEQLLITSKVPNRIEEIFVQTTYDFESVGNEYKRGSQIGGSFSYRSYDRLMQMPLYSTYDNNDAVAKVNEFLQRL